MPYPLLRQAQNELTQDDIENPTTTRHNSKAFLLTTLVKTSLIIALHKQQ